MESVIRLMFWIIGSVSILLSFDKISSVSAIGGGGGVFRVQHKFGLEWSLGAVKEHDTHRHGRRLAGIDLPLGGNGSPTGSGLYYTKIGIGSPSSDYFVHIDTGSDIFWVNCIDCQNCPKKSDIGVDLKLYNPRISATGETITCSDQFCKAISTGSGSDCSSGGLCGYVLSYGDGSATGGYFVKDFIRYDQVSGNLQTTSRNASVIFGCSVQLSGNLAQSSMATDGILGFGQANTSVISQLASAKVVKKKFAHCLDGINGGGIFAIGNVVKPKVNTTPLVPNQPHYNVNLENIAVGKDIIKTNSLGTNTVIDSGTTLAYLPQELFDPLMDKIMAGHPDLQVNTVEDIYKCFHYNGSLDNDFPAVTLNFENSLSLTVLPHEYFFKVKEYGLCVGWQNSAVLSKDVNGLTLLGDLVLSNKLVVYDLENQALGWTNYNCSSTIELQDDQSGSTFQVGAEDLSSATTFKTGGRSAMMVLLVSVLLSLIH